MLTKTPPPTELQIPATVTTLKLMIKMIKKNVTEITTNISAGFGIAVSILLRLFEPLVCCMNDGSISRAKQRTDLEMCMYLKQEKLRCIEWRIKVASDLTATYGPRGCK